MSKKSKIPKSTLHKDTYAAIWECIKASETKAKALDEISSKTGLGFAWLEHFTRSLETSPSVDRVEHLKRYLENNEL